MFFFDKIPLRTSLKCYDHIWKTNLRCLVSLMVHNRLSGCIKHIIVTYKQDFSWLSKVSHCVSFSWLIKFAHCLSVSWLIKFALYKSVKCVSLARGVLILRLEYLTWLFAPVMSTTSHPKATDTPMWHCITRLLVNVKGHT